TGTMVLFGEHTKRMKEADGNTVRVFLDKNGDYYPPGLFINDVELYTAGGTLHNWYKQYPGSFDSVCNALNVLPSVDFNLRLQWLNNAICQYYANIVAQAGNKQPVLLIHGFRKRAYTKPDMFTYLASTDNEILRETISKL